MTDLGSILITGAIIFTGTVVTCIAAFVVGTLIGRAFYRHWRPANPNLDIDYDALQREMDEEFSPIRKFEGA